MADASWLMRTSAASIVWSDASARSPGGASYESLPAYLSAHYWWAYIHPRAVKFFERQWLVNLILWGNYRRLRDAVLSDLSECSAGRTLQVACAYGDLTNKLAGRAAADNGAIDIIDVVPIQLSNLRSKLPPNSPARLLIMDSADLKLPDASYDCAVLFFLLHEQPRRYRERTLEESFRVVKPGGRIVIIDYARPRWWHPLRYLWGPVLAQLEPFALDLWRHEITTWCPRLRPEQVRRNVFFGGLYQKLVITR